MKILLTGASGVMGLATLKELAKQNIPVRAFCLNRRSEIRKIAGIGKHTEIFIGDMQNYDDVYRSLEGIDMILHCAGLIPPAADKNPVLTMRVNYGSTKHILRAMEERQMLDSCKLVFISSVAVYGDRLPPIHWCRVGDPVKCSYYDYYSVSKIACERLIVESTVKDWVILRQTGVISPSMIGHRSSLVMHMPLNNVLEYISDRDSGRLLAKIVQEPDKPIWKNLYNIGGGKAMRLASFQLYDRAFSQMGIKHAKEILEPRFFARRNFHGVFYLDSDRLENLFGYVQDGADYIDTCSDRYLKGFAGLLRGLLKFPPIAWLAERIVHRQFMQLSMDKNGPLHMLAENDPAKKQAFFLGKAYASEQSAADAEPERIDYEKQLPLNHGYDEQKDPSLLCLEDMQHAAVFRGGKCLSTNMKQGDWAGKLDFACAFGHHFTASPRLVLKAGHWCPDCEKKSWRPQEIAASNPFFAQVWYPLHNKDEAFLEVEKMVSEDIME